MQYQILGRFAFPDGEKAKAFLKFIEDNQTLGEVYENGWVGEAE